MKKRSKVGPIVLLVLGAILLLGPVWGILGTVVGMTRAFEKIGNSTAGSPEALASDISLSLQTTAAGLIASPIGLAVLIGAIIWLVQIHKKEKETIEPTTEPYSK